MKAKERLRLLQRLLQNLKPLRNDSGTVSTYAIYSSGLLFRRAIFSGFPNYSRGHCNFRSQKSEEEGGEESSSQLYFHLLHTLAMVPS